MRRVLGLALLAVLSAASPYLTVLSDHSFRPPFTLFDGDGARRVDNWAAGGSTEVQNSFVRVTNDRQSRKGWLWSTRNWAHLDGFTVTLRFRISGQGKKLFGDGLAFWFTTSPVYQSGPVHGFTDMFRGLGIVFDTYVNTGAGASTHRDVLVISNDGTGSKLAPHGGSNDPNPSGCDADFR